MRARLVLASASPRRADLLREHGFEFDIDPAEIEEQTPAHLTTAEIALWNARAKAFHVAPRHQDAVVLGVDTLVSLDGRPVGKPADLDEAFTMVSQLSGRAHEVFSGVCAVRAESRHMASFIEKSVVHFRAVMPDEIRSYLAEIHPLDKAGGYAAQQDRHGIISRIEGSRTNVIGLPMERLVSVLRSQFSFPLPASAAGRWTPSAQASGAGCA